MTGKNTPREESLSERDGETCRVHCVHAERVRRAHDEAGSASVAEELAPMFKALGDPTRLRLLLALRGGEMCVCDLAAFLGSSESSVSHHLRHLRQLALVRRRREGQMLFYSLDDDHVEAILKIGLDHRAHSEGRSKR